ncbi:FAD-dependent monooxygenase [Propionibacteriaceae bacterium Y2011]
MRLRVLISGAGIAGPVLAHWLARNGATPTIVERRAGPMRTGGHAVDIAGVSSEVIQRMGLWDKVQDARVQRGRMTFRRRRGRPLTMSRLSDRIADDHVEIQRDALINILQDETYDDVEYLFGDEVTALRDHTTGPGIRPGNDSSDPQACRGVLVSFQHGADRVFDLVVGADGLHSGVRRLTFGPEERFRHDLGAFLAVFTHPNSARLDPDTVVGYAERDRASFAYSVDDGTDARALMIFRDPEAPSIPHRDTARQVEFVQDAYRDVDPALLPFPLAAAATADDFYFDPISQIRMNTWSHGRVTLIGDAAYSPGPAVGGGTALAIVGAYVLANELALADGYHVSAFANTERVMGPSIRQSRKVGPSTLQQLVPQSAAAAWAMPRVLRLFTKLPPKAVIALFSLQGADTTRLDDLTSQNPEYAIA